jgi:hypothetical protein
MKFMRSLLPAVLLVPLLLTMPSVVLADGPVNLALVPSVQIVGETESVSVFRLGLWSRNANMTGFDAGIIGQNTGSFTGYQLTGVGLVDGDFTGWQNGWLACVAQGNMQGLQTGAYTKSGMGSSGVQFGLYNTSDDFSGLQIGVVNVATTMRKGLQIGLINIIKNKEKLKLFPIVNWRF